MLETQQKLYDVYCVSKFVIEEIAESQALVFWMFGAIRCQRAGLGTTLRTRCATSARGMVSGANCLQCWRILGSSRPNSCLLVASTVDSDE